MTKSAQKVETFRTKINRLYLLMSLPEFTHYQKLNSFSVRYSGSKQILNSILQLVSIIQHLFNNQLRSVNQGVSLNERTTLPDNLLNVVKLVDLVGLTNVGTIWLTANRPSRFYKLLKIF